MRVTASSSAILFQSLAIFSGLFLLLAIVFGQGSKAETGGADSPQVIDVIAKSYEFMPSEIHVRKGARVRLRLRTADRAHGLMLDIYPEGTPPVGNPGLIFAHPQDTAKVERDQERIIEFVAARMGTYNFKCSVQCGLIGHGRMKGKLIVDQSGPDCESRRCIGALSASSAGFSF